MVKEMEVMEAWRQLLTSCEASRVQVTSVTDKVQFFSVVRENLMWMEGIMGQIRWDEPRYAFTPQLHFLSSVVVFG
jgi:spectrin beta